ncbi:hypothetical protein MANES_01G027350v8 [Manihot esculenta]|uniref:Uncharacterized protein n=1 Tax=Manihot esculenta TaxID=3983 RepID=A0ACB7ICN4_MANES|nr:hypothetical protein MANES_01G027350v8 [Manihot esculenta]
MEWLGDYFFTQESPRALVCRVQSRKRENLRRRILIAISGGAETRAEPLRILCPKRIGRCFTVIHSAHYSGLTERGLRSHGCIFFAIEHLTTFDIQLIIEPYNPAVSQLIFEKIII